MDFAGIRYIPDKRESSHTKLIIKGEAIPIGCSIVLMETTLMRKGDSAKRNLSPEDLRENKALMGHGTLIKLTTWNGSYNYTIIPIVSLLKDEVLRTYKLLVHRDRVAGMHVS